MIVLIMTSHILKLTLAFNEKSFEDEIKIIFHHFNGLS